jgi:hypothetical protein
MVEESGNLQSKELSWWTRKTTNARASRAFVMFERARSFAATFGVTLVAKTLRSPFSAIKQNACSLLRGEIALASEPLPGAHRLSFAKHPPQIWRSLSFPFSTFRTETRLHCSRPSVLDEKD